MGIHTCTADNRERKVGGGRDQGESRMLLTLGVSGQGAETLRRALAEPLRNPATRRNYLETNPD